MERAENSGRARVLARIRAALKVPAPRQEGSVPAGPIFAPVADPVARFQEECAANSSECMRMPDVPAAEEALRTVLASIPPGELYVEDAPLLHRIVEALHGEHKLRWSSEGRPNEGSQAAITLAEALVASHGSLLLASAAAGRSASVAAPVHIVVASESQIVPDLAGALAQVKIRRLEQQNSCLFLITGSSRTADIEKILVLGAHGPRRVVVILVRDLGAFARC